MTRQQYNAKIQEIQAMGFENRVVARHAEATGYIHQALFEVYWSGKWHCLGYARPPFRADAEFFWDDDKAIELQAQFATELVHS